MAAVTDGAIRDGGGAGGGGVTYPLLASFGSAAAPSYSFAGRTNDGFYSGGAGILELALGGNPYWMYVNTQTRMGSNVTLGWTTGPDPNGTSPDVQFIRTGPGSVGINGLVNGQQQTFGELTENVIIAAAATSTSVIQLPVGATLKAVTSRVTTIGSASWPATYSVAVGATTVGSGISTVLNTTDPGTLLCPISKAAATSVTITPNTTPGDALGRIRITIHYELFTPATS